jgi:hypothetical protein
MWKPSVLTWPATFSSPDCGDGGVFLAVVMSWPATFFEAFDSGRHRHSQDSSGTRRRAGGGRRARRPARPPPTQPWLSENFDHLALGG